MKQTIKKGKEHFDTCPNTLKQKMMMEEAVSSAELAMEKDSRKESWKDRFVKRFFVYKLGGKFPDHVGAEKEAIEFISQEITSAKQEVWNNVEKWIRKSKRNDLTAMEIVFVSEFQSFINQKRKQ